jgi:hypothetical protein
MKTAMLIILATCHWCTAQTAEQRKLNMGIPLMFRAVRSKAEGTKGTTWATSYGSSERTNARTLTYTCEARWNGATETNFTCQAYWIAHAPAAGDFVIDTTYELPLLEPGRTTKWTMASPEITEEKTSYVALGQSTYYGAKLKGVIIRMVGNSDDANKFPLNVYASSFQWIKHGWTEDPNSQFKFDPIGDLLKKRHQRENE